jgi:glycopeptide antibiotics resistance protein
LRLGPNTLLAIAVLYAVAVAMITVVPMRATADKLTRVNVVPLASVAACIHKADGLQIPRRCIGNILGNVLLFVPLGVLLTAITRWYRSPVFPVITASLLSISIEAIQYAERTVPIGRTVDIDDVLWNTIGAYIGFTILRRWRERFVAPPR